MTTITHKTLPYWLTKLSREPQLACGASTPRRTWSEWFDQPCTLEFPLGELCKDDPFLRRMALLGRAEPNIQPLTGHEGFDAQGLEGKLTVHKPLINALLNLRDLLPERRGRILLPKTRRP